MGLDSKMASSGYIILNLLRVANIISLLLVAVASWVIIFMIIKTNSFFFFDALTHLTLSFISLFLLLSELSLFERYFEKHWPLLSSESGFVFLGMSMIMLGSGILSHFDKAEISVNKLGLPLWRAVISSGVLSSIFGLFNIIATYVFCDYVQGITSRQVRIHGVNVRAKMPESYRPFSISSSSMRRLSPLILPRYNTSSRHRRLSSFRKPNSFIYPLKHHSVQDSIISTHTFGSSSLSEEKLKELNKPLPVIKAKFPPISTPRTHHLAAPSVSSKYSEVSNMTRF